MNIKASTKKAPSGKIKRMIVKRTNKRIRQDGKKMMEDAPPYRGRNGYMT